MDEKVGFNCKIYTCKNCKALLAENPWGGKITKCKRCRCDELEEAGTLIAESFEQLILEFNPAISAASSSSKNFYDAVSTICNT